MIKEYFDYLPRKKPFREEVKSFQFWKSIRTEFLSTLIFVIISCGILIASNSDLLCSVDVDGDGEVAVQSSEQKSSRTSPSSLFQKEPRQGDSPNNRVDITSTVHDMVVHDVNNDRSSSGMSGQSSGHEKKKRRRKRMIQGGGREGGLEGESDGSRRSKVDSSGTNEPNVTTSYPALSPPPITSSLILETSSASSVDMKEKMNKKTNTAAVEQEHDDEGKKMTRQNIKQHSDSPHTSSNSTNSFTQTPSESLLSSSNTLKVEPAASIERIPSQKIHKNNGNKVNSIKRCKKKKEVPSSVYHIKNALGVSMLTLLLMVVTFNQINGHLHCHLNPCLSLTSFICRDMSLLKLVMFIIAQCLASIFGSMIVLGLTNYKRTFGHSDTLEQIHHHDVHGRYLGTTINDHSNDGILNSLHPSYFYEGTIPANNLFGFEFIGTFLIILTYLSVTEDWNERSDGHKFGPTASFSIVATSIFVSHLFAANHSGASFNPIRVLGPSISTSIWTNHWVYWVGPLMGSIFASITFEYIKSSKPPNQRRRTNGRDSSINSKKECSTTNDNDEDNVENGTRGTRTAEWISGSGNISSAMSASPPSAISASASFSNTRSGGGGGGGGGGSKKKLNKKDENDEKNGTFEMKHSVSSNLNSTILKLNEVESDEIKTIFTSIEMED